MPHSLRASAERRTHESTKRGGSAKAAGDRPRIFLVRARTKRALGAQAVQPRAGLGPRVGIEEETEPARRMQTDIRLTPLEKCTTRDGVAAPEV